MIQREYNKTQHETTRVQHDTARHDTSAKRYNTSKTRENTSKIYFDLFISLLYTWSPVYQALSYEKTFEWTQIALDFSSLSYFREKKFQRNNQLVQKK